MNRLYTKLVPKTALLLLLAFCFTLVLPSVAFAVEDLANAAGDVSKGASQEAAAIADLVKDAIQGDSQALATLIQTKVVPALCLVAALILAWSVTGWISRYIGGMVSKKVDLTLGKFLTKAIRNMLMLGVLMGVFQYFGGDITAFAALIAALGFAIGMALQGTLGNIASGVMLLLFRPFKVDDYIVVADTEGTVEEIDLFTTRINTLDNRHIIIPNNEIFGSKLENYTRNDLRRVDVNVGAAYTADIARTRARQSIGN